MLNRQRGVSVLSTLFTVLILGGVLLLMFKIIPVYSEYIEVKNILTEISKDPHQSEIDVRKQFQIKANVADVKSVKADDLLVAAGGNFLTVRAKYRREVPLFANVSLVFDFDTTAGQNPAAQSQ
jgi:hypothetical protein